MNNPNPFLPQSSFLEQKNKARVRLRIAVLFSISLSVMVLVVLLVQGCRKNDTGTAENNSATPAPELANNNPSPETNATPTNVAPPPVPVPESNTPPPAPPTPPPAPESTTTEYTVVKGDTFATIVKNYPGLSVKALEQANPTVNPRTLRIGQKLHVPQVSATSVGAPAGAPEAAPGGGGGEQTYKVKSGDNLTTIARQFHTTIKAIQSANDMKTTSIRVGQTLKIPAKAGAEPAPAPETGAPPPVSPPTVPPPAMPEATSSNH